MGPTRIDAMGLPPNPGRLGKKAISGLRPRFTAESGKPEPKDFWSSLLEGVAHWLGLQGWFQRRQVQQSLLKTAKNLGLDKFTVKADTPLTEHHPLIRALAAKAAWGEPALNQILEKSLQVVTADPVTVSVREFYTVDLPLLVKNLQSPEDVTLLLTTLENTSGVYHKCQLACSLVEASGFGAPGYWGSVMTLVGNGAPAGTLLANERLGALSRKKVPWERWREIDQFLKAVAEKTPDALKSVNAMQNLFVFIRQPLTSSEWQAGMKSLTAQAKQGKDVWGSLNQQMLDWASRQKGIPEGEWLDDFLRALSFTFTSQYDLWHYGEMREVMNKGKHLKFALLYNQMSQNDPEALITFTPHLMLNLPPGSINQYLRHLEYELERIPKGQGYHPNEAELMLLLRHPKDPKREQIGQLTNTITSAYRFLYQGISNIPDRVAKLWSDAGFLSHSFRFWRYDSQGGDNSLLAQYGFQKSLPRKTDAVFGPGYLLSKALRPEAPIDEKTLIEFRRAYLLVSHPAHGTLVIRNSSKEFGRNTMRHPAYFSQVALTSKDLKTFDVNTRMLSWPPLNSSGSLFEMPQDPEKFKSMLDPRLYPTRVKLHKNGKDVEKEIISKDTEAMETLIKELLKVKEDYRRWKFDTGAFKNKHFVGHESPGFRKMLEKIGQWAELDRLGLETQAVPELGFVHPEYPPWETYPFTDQQGVSQRTFKLTPAHRRELRQYLTGKLSGRVLQQSDWYRFLKTGIRNRAELVLLAPEASTVKQGDEG